MSDRMDEIRSTRAPRLRTDQIRILKRYGQIRKTEVGDVLFRAGDTENDFIVVLEGEVKVGDDFPGEWRTIGTFHEGRFLGELNMLTGQAMYLTGVVSEAGEVLSITRERLKEVVTEEPNISDIILRAFLARRSYMVKERPWPEDYRLAPLGRRDAPQGVRGPQPRSPRLDGTGG